MSLIEALIAVAADSTQGSSEDAKDVIRSIIGRFKVVDCTDKEIEVLARCRQIHKYMLDSDQP